MVPQELHPTDGTVCLRPSRARHALFAAGSAVFVAAGVAMVAGGSAMGWFVAGFFGLCLAIFMLNLLPGSAQLELAPEGFTVRSLGRARFTRWADVDGFHEWTNPSAPLNRHVAIDLAEHAEPSSAGGRLMLAVGRGLGAEGILPDTYGLSVSELREVMEAWRQRHG